jgi:hypothetical protein
MRDAMSFILLTLALLLAAPAAADLVVTPPTPTDDKDPSKRQVLSVMLLPGTPRPRSHSTIPVDIMFRNRSSSILEGRLLLEFFDPDGGTTGGSQVLTRIETPEVAIANGEQTIAYSVPAMSAYGSGDGPASVMVNPVFVTSAGQKLQLQPTPFFVSSKDRNNMAICVSGGESMHGRQVVSKLSDALRFENMVKKSLYAGQRRFRTTPVRRRARQLPSAPAGYCAYDIVLLVNNGFVGLEQRQLEALATWVEAGGTVIVAPQGRTLLPEHRAFLERLCGTDDFVVENGVYVSSRSHLLRRSELGRTIVMTKLFADEREYQTAAFYRLAAFAWKLRSLHDDGFVASPTNQVWDPNTIAKGGEQVNGTGDLYPAKNFARRYAVTYGANPLVATFQKQHLSDSLANGLKPKSVRVIPFIAILAILLGYLVLIGPADYWLLGKIRQRKLTWILFPIVTIAVTAGTVMLANHFMGRTDISRSITVVDLGAGGKVLRHNRFQLLFSASEQTVNIDGRNASVSTFAASSYQQGMMNINFGYPTGNQKQAVSTEPLMIKGRMPSNYQVSMPMKQWSSRMLRWWSFGAPDSLPDVALNWDGLRPITSTRENLEQTVFKGTQARGSMYVFSRYRLRRVRPPDDAPFVSETLLHDMTVAPHLAMFAVVSRRAPIGGAQWDDLMLLDPTKPGESVLVVVVADGDDYVIFRRLFEAKG